jgi:hypothetical protein
MSASLCPAWSVALKTLDIWFLMWWAVRSREVGDEVASEGRWGNGLPTDRWEVARG